MKLTKFEGFSFFFVFPQILENFIRERRITQILNSTDSQNLEISREKMKEAFRICGIFYNIQIRWKIRRNVQKYESLRWVAMSKKFSLFFPFVFFDFLNNIFLFDLKKRTRKSAFEIKILGNTSKIFLKSCKFSRIPLGRLYLARAYGL